MQLLPRRDAQLVVAIQTGGPAGRRAQEYLYKQRNFKRLGIEKVKILGGNAEDGLSMMHEAFAILISNIQNNRYEDRNSLKAYFLSIVKNQWLNAQQKRRKEQLVPEHHPRQDETPNPEHQLIEAEIKQMTYQLLDQLDKVCHTILLLDIEGYNHQEIAQHLGWTDNKQVRDRKYKCRKRFREKHADQFAYLQNLLNRKNG